MLTKRNKRLIPFILFACTVPVLNWLVFYVYPNASSIVMAFLDAEGNPSGPYCEDLAANPDMLEMTYPGLSAIETNQLLAYMPMMSAVAYEVVLVEVANEADVAAVEAILQARIDAQVAGGAWYPETIEQWEQNSRIVSYGNFILMAVGTDCDYFVEAFGWNF